MDKRTIKERIRNDFDFLHDKKDVLGLLLYGSFARDDATGRSDIDICIVAPDGRKMLLREVLSRIRSKQYDVGLFESMPLYLKIEVILNHEVIFTRDILKLYEYFYFFRKMWKDQQFRQRLNREEALELF